MLLDGSCPDPYGVVPKFPDWEMKQKPLDRQMRKTKEKVQTLRQEMKQMRITQVKVKHCEGKDNEPIKTILAADVNGSK